MSPISCSSPSLGILVPVLNPLFGREGKGRDGREGGRREEEAGCGDSSRVLIYVNVGEAGRWW